MGECGASRSRSDRVHGHQVRHQLAAVDTALRIQILNDGVVGIGETPLVQGDAELTDSGQAAGGGAAPADAGPVAPTTATALSSRTPAKGVTRLFRISISAGRAATEGRAGRHSATLHGSRAFTRCRRKRLAQVVATSSSSPRAVRNPSVRPAK